MCPSAVQIQLCLIPGFTVKPVLRDHCHKKPLALKDYLFLAEGHTFQWIWELKLSPKITCLERPYFGMPNGAVF